LEVFSKIQRITTPDVGLIRTYVSLLSPCGCAHELLVNQLQSPLVVPDAIAAIRHLHLELSEVLSVTQFASDVFGLLAVGSPLDLLTFYQQTSVISIIQF
jgi:hypothetical protein